MRTRHRHTWNTLLTTIVIATVAVLISACSSGSAPALPTISPEQMQETLDRVLEMGPQLKKQLEDIEKLHPGMSAKCASAYPERCIPPPPPYLDCRDIAHRNFLVLPPDPHGFDPDHDGVGCEQ